ncbi:hypothetical protein QAD02_016496 [Eretmocerus hayati]|uniref:Uncharacterized protein n=1 Tax=Eretmocerus hayati TaxID=131215 RepID=A0ACC2PAR8_9HYME|nr:hypothetical protein QAD02_016496 [Eretmocerus hayati]
MNNYGEITNPAAAENNRCSLRKIARHEEPEFSNASILNSMEKFVKAVNEMEETILVPSRLLDLAVGDANDTICPKAGIVKGGNVSGSGVTSIKDSLSNTDLYRLYNIVNQMKVELLWSQDSADESRDEEALDQQQQQQQQESLAQHRAKAQAAGHARCPSTTSMQSLQSASSLISATSSSGSASDSDSDLGIENDSGLESEEPSDRLANLAADDFRRHLRGLHRSISRMTEAAEYLTLRYQADVGGQV